MIGAALAAVATTAPQSAHAPTRRADRLLPDFAFAALVALGVVFVIAEMHGFSFYGDEWDLLVDRRGTGARVLLTPHGPHLSLLPILVYKAMLQIFGMRSYTPYKALAAADMVMLALAVGIFTRRRWGPWWGLVPVVFLVTLGPGAETLLFPFQVGLITATVAGIIALVAADHGGRRADALACAALLVALASGSQGIGALVGAAVIVALAPERLRRAWVVLVPAVLYTLWYAHYGSANSQTHIEQWASAVPYAMQALSSTLSALTGLAMLDYNPVPYINPAYGQPLALALLITVGIALWRGWRPPRLFWGAVATLIVLWISAALSNTPMFQRPPETGRYLPVDVAFMFVAAAAALPRPHVSVGGRVVACVALAVVAATNAGEFASNRQPYSTAADPSRTALAAVLIARGIVGPAFNPGSGQPTFLDNVTAGPFFGAVDAFGTNAFTAAQLLRAPESEREFADRALVSAERIGLAPVAPAAGATLPPPAVLSGAAAVRGGCLLVAGSTSVTARVPAGGIQIDAPHRSSANVSVARFGLAFTPFGQLGTVSPGAAATLRPPPDHAPQVSWRVSVSGRGARLCSV
jgi:hypothetical protein